MENASSSPLFQRIRVTLDELTVAICNRIDRERYHCLESRHGILPFLLKSIVRIAQVELQCIAKLVYNTCDGYLPSPEFAIAVPPLARTYVDALYTVMFICDNPSRRGRLYVASGVAAAAAYHARLHARYGTAPEHIPWFDDHQRWIDSHDAADNPTLEETKKPRSLFWPSPGTMRSEMQSASCKAFMEFVDEWFYRYLSQDAHFAYMGIARHGGLLAGQPSETLQTYRKIVFSTALALYVTLLSEVIVESRLPTEARRIRQVWEDLLQIEPVAQLWHARYAELITGICDAS